MAHPQHIGHIVDKLSDPHNLETTAYLVYANLGKGGADLVANALSKNKRIRKINLSKNHLDANSIGFLTPAFHALTKLESLDLGHNQLGSAGLKKLLPALAEHLSLRTLDLANNLIGEQAASAVADFLKQSQSIYHLSLHDNQINHTCMAIIQPGLQANHALRSLHLSHNPLDDAAVVMLATAIQTHPNLEKLFLGHTQMGDVGLKALIHACEQQKMITTLDLSLNRITDKSMPVLAGFIEKTQSLYTLDLQQNKITDAGVRILLTALEHNRTICTVHLSGNNIDPSLLNEINQRIAYNRQIEQLYQELQQLQKRANLEAMAVHKEYLYNKSAPVAYRLMQEHFRDAGKQLKIIQHRLGKLAAPHDPIAAWTYLAPLGDSFNDIRTLMIRTMVTFAKQAGGNQAFYEKALLLMRENGEPHNIETELLEVVMGILVARNLVTPEELQEFSNNLHQLIGAEKVVTMNNLVQVAHHVRDSIKENEKTTAFTKVCLQPGYVSADEVDAFLRIPIVRKECIHRFNTANLVTYEHLLICPEATALNHALRGITVKKIMEGVVHSEKDLTHFTMHQTRIEQTFQEAIGQYELTLQKALTVFYEAVMQNAHAPQVKYQIILEIYESKLPLGEKIIDMLNYLLVICHKENDPWANSQLERVLTTTVGENIDTAVITERVMQLTHALIGTKQLTIWQTRRLLLVSQVEKKETWLSYLPWKLWRKFRLSSALRRADGRMDARDRFRLLSKYLGLV